MKKTPKPSVVLHPQAQVIITGKTLLPEQVTAIKPLIDSGFCVANWLNDDGCVGHLGSIEPKTTLEKFNGDMEKLREYKFLDLGITLMSGPPGTFVMPVVSYSLKNGNLTQNPNAHFSHPPPRRFKK